MHRGRKHFARGALAEAEACCIRALARHNTLAAAHELLIRVLMPGDDYQAVLSRLHQRLKPASYMEIGVRTGDSLALAGEQTTAIGIDPRLTIKRSIRSRARLYPLSSDQFFDRYDLLEELRWPRLALAFLDGLHLFEQTLRDFIHVERYADPETVIVIHDCIPVTSLLAARERRSRYWCGDVWKIVPCLRKYRPDLAIRIIPARPSGLAVISGADPRSTLLHRQFDDIVPEYQGRELGYECLDSETLKAMPGLVVNDPAHIDRAVGGFPSDS